MEEFLEELKHIPNGDLESLTDFCRKKVLHGMPFIFKEKEEDYYNFRKKIANHFDVPFHEVFITGSAKLGFSPLKNTKFSLDSDIDVAIISETLFEKQMKIISIYQTKLRNNRKSITLNELKIYHQFLEYTAIGWIRPDKLPVSLQIVSELKSDWFGFFHGLSNGNSEVGNYKVSAGVFKNYDYFEKYTLTGFEKVQNTL